MKKIDESLTGYIDTDQNDNNYINTRKHKITIEEKENGKKTIHIQSHDLESYGVYMYPKHSDDMLTVLFCILDDMNK